MLHLSPFLPVARQIYRTGRQYRIEKGACAISSRFFAKAREVRPRLQPVEVHGGRPHESYLRAAGAASSIFAPLRHFLHKALSPSRPIDLFLAHTATSIGFPVSFHQVDPDFDAFAFALAPAHHTTTRR